MTTEPSRTPQRRSAPRFTSRAPGKATPALQPGWRRAAAATTAASLTTRACLQGSARGRARHRRRRDVHRCGSARRRARGDGEGAHSRGAGGVGGGGRSRGRGRGRRALHPRDHGRDQRAAGAEGRANSVLGNRRLRAPSPSAAPGASAPLSALRATSGAARPDRVLLRRARADRTGRRARGARPRLAARDRHRGDRRVLALLVPGRVARAGGCGRAATPVAGRGRGRVARGRAGVPRVRARVDDGGRRVPRARNRSLSGGPRPLRAGGRPARAARDALVGRPRHAGGGRRAPVDRARLGAGGRRGRGRTCLRSRRDRERDLVRHGRDVDRRLPDRRR